MIPIMSGCTNPQICPRWRVNLSPRNLGGKRVNLVIAGAERKRDLLPASQKHRIQDPKSAIPQ
jgi:hypothetical protein